VWFAQNPKFLNPRRLTTRDGLPSDRITALLKDRDGAIWIGTENGIARFNGNKIEKFPANDPLSNDAINALFEDREGDIWIGGDITGLSILRPQKFVTYSFREPAGSSKIRCVSGTSDGSVWIGTDGAGLKRLREGQFSTLTTADGLSSNVILSLAAESDGSLLVGTPDGLDRIPKNGRPVSYSKTQSFAEDFVRSLFVDQDGSIWVGTRRGLSHASGTRVTTYTQSDGLGSDTVGALLRDTHGNLWIGTFHGLSRMDQTGLHNYTRAQGLSGNIITDLYQDSRGAIWIATQDGGLDVYRNGSFSHFLPPNLPRTIFGMTEDRTGSFWIVAKTGIFRMNADSSNIHNCELVAYGTTDGLRVSEGSGAGHPAIWRAQNGDLWFATAHGAALLASAANSLNRTVPPVAIESVSVDDVSYAPSQLKSIPAGKSRVSFEYAGLSFLAPQKVQYKYRLEGFDKDWIDAGTRRVAYYTNLSPRTYRFRVIARNNDGFWNLAGASLSVHILPLFYQTWWFFVLVLWAAVTGSYAVYFWHLHQVRSRYEAVLAERNRIAREIHDTLAQGFVGVSVQLELVSRLMATSVGSARDHLDQARILVRRCLSEARQSIWELRSQESAASDFAARFSKLAQQISESSAVKVQLLIHGQYRSLQPLLEDELFRIGQEAIANAVRHSGAQHVCVTLAFDSKRLRMTIADSGCGFTGRVNSLGPDGHFGLKGMRERAERIKAELNIESTPGVGTTISVEAPAR
jgi:signal transduction histidine kinase